jgi:hypothetical protein
MSGILIMIDGTMKHRWIRPLKTILSELSFDEKKWSQLHHSLKCPLVVLTDESKGVSDCLKILNAHHYSNNYKVLKQTELFDKTTDQALTLFQMLGEAELKKAKEVFDFLLTNSAPIHDTVNGVFILIKPPGVETKTHIHTLDAQQFCPPQRVFWWSPGKTLPTFWFEKNNEKIFWDQDLNSTNYYELNSRIPHGGVPSKHFTIYFITFGRTFPSYNDYQNFHFVEDDNILFASLNLPKIESKNILKFIKSAPEVAWFQDEYRNSSVLPLMTNNGGSQLSDIKNQSSQTQDYEWTPWAHQDLRNYFDQHLWPWLGQKSRITILRTLPKGSNFEHIDCSANLMGSKQLKFRIVLQGQSDTLYFITSKEKVWAPKTDCPFIIDGSWPHGMINSSNEIKYTLCLGAPWSHSEKYPYFEKVLYKNDFELPTELEPFFRKT